MSFANLPYRMGVDMTWRNWAWGGKRGLVLALFGLFFISIGVVVFIQDSTTNLQLGICIAILLIVFVGIAIMHNWIEVGDDAVKIGFFPMFRKTLQYSDIADLSIVDVKPFRQYGGWGVRGFPEYKYGMMFGGFPSSGLRFELHDERRYVITFENLDPILRALAQHGCTLSAGNEHAFSGKV